MSEVCYPLEVAQAHGAQMRALKAALEYVADNTYIGRDGTWRFKEAYNPQIVLDALNGQSTK